MQRRQPVAVELAHGLDRCDNGCAVRNVPAGATFALRTLQERCR